MLSFNGEVKELAYSTNFETQGKNALSLAFDGNKDSYFWTKGGPKKDDYILISVPTKQSIKEITVLTGAPEKKDDWLRTGVIEVSGDGLSFEALANFKNGKASIKFPSPKNYKFIRVRATGSQGNWLVIREIIIK